MDIVLEAILVLWLYIKFTGLLNYILIMGTGFAILEKVTIIKVFWPLYMSNRACNSRVMVMF